MAGPPGNFELSSRASKPSLWPQGHGLLKGVLSWLRTRTVVLLRRMTDATATAKAFIWMRRISSLLLLACRKTQTSWPFSVRLNGAIGSHGLQVRPAVAEVVYRLGQAGLVAQVKGLGLALALALEFRDSDSLTDTFGDRTRCVAPVDTVFGLPTACLGDYFDLDLDDQQDYADVDSNTQFQAFLSELDPEEGQDGELPAKLVRSLHRRGILDGVASGLGKVWNGGKKLLGSVYNGVKESLSFAPSFNKDFPFQIPNPASNDAGAKTPKDTSIKQVQSPWGGRPSSQVFRR